jgi:hypothetical protein
MLQVLDHLKSRSQPPRHLHPAVIIHAISVAHSSWPADQRAWLAAGWITGRVLVEPTIGLASHTFGVSRPLIKKILDRYRTSPSSQALALLARGWQLATPQERARFCAFFEYSSWEALEHVCDSTEHA